MSIPKTSSFFSKNFAFFFTASNVPGCANEHGRKRFPTDPPCLNDWVRSTRILVTRSFLHFCGDWINISLKGWSGLRTGEWSRVSRYISSASFLSVKSCSEPKKYLERVKPAHVLCPNFDINASDWHKLGQSLHIFLNFLLTLCLWLGCFLNKIY